MLRSNLFKLISYNSTRSIKSLLSREPPPTYGNARMPDKLYKTIELEMRSAEPAVMESYSKFLTMAAQNLGIQVGKKWVIKPTKERWTLLKSVHIYRKHMVQYEVRTHYCCMQLHKLTGSTADTYLEYVERMLPEGVALKVTRVSIEPLPSHLTAKMIENEKLEEEGVRTEKEDIQEEKKV